MKKLNLPILLLLIVFFAGCQNLNSSDGTSTDNSSFIPAPGNGQSDLEAETEDQGYPAGNEEAYPPLAVDSSNDVEAGYPAPERVYDESKRFEISEPLVPGQSDVSGIGPANVTIRIVSVSNSGETLATGLISEDGTFSFPLLRELNTTEAIAIMLADESMREDFLDAPGATDIPLTGFVLDMAAVTQP